MDATRFDTLTQGWSTRRSRRTALRLVGVPALGSVLGLLGMSTAGATHEPGLCLPNGSRCGQTDDPACCSGRCKRKRDTNKKFCRAAPGQGICTIEGDTCLTGSHACDAGGTFSCTCYVTTTGRSFCGDNDSATCVNCQSDRDCEERPEVGQRGDRCVQGPACCPDTGNRLCVHKCPTPATM
jgi:hypothetical protein